MHCPACDKKLQINKRTCSWKCAGILAHSSKYANQLRKEFDNPEKQQIRKYLYKLIKNQGHSVNNHGGFVLDFWGGGLFSDYILDQEQRVNNHFIPVLYEIDENPKLFPALKDYANRKNQECFVKNQRAYVQPFCGSLAKFVQGKNVNNQRMCDFIWLDYFGTFKKLRDDMEFVEKISEVDTIIAITLCRRGDDSIDRQSRKKDVATLVSDYLPLHRETFHKAYGGKSGMEIYIYKVSAKLRRMKAFRKEGYEESTRSGGTAPTINPIIY